MVSIKMEARSVRGKDLKPGDLFSASPVSLWGDVNTPVPNKDGKLPLAERVGIRTNVPCPEEQLESEVTLITVSYVDEDAPAPVLDKEHAAYHVDIVWDEETKSKAAELSPNRGCPYCFPEQQEVPDDTIN